MSRRDKVRSLVRALKGAAFALGLAAAVLVAVSAYAVRVPGRPAKAACYAVFDVQGGTANGRKVSCNAGDPTCDIGTPIPNSCNFMVRYCLNDTQTAPGCTPAGLKKIRSKLSPGGIVFPTQPTDSSCGAYTAVPVKLRGKKKPKKNQKVVNLAAVASKGFKPRLEAAKLVLVCNPGTTTTSTTLPPPSTCSPNPTGPSQLTITIRPNAGADLDTGWTGTSHNFSVPGNASVTYCLSNCDASGTCSASASAGPGNTLDGQYFGPPVPLLAGGAPVCLVDRFKDTTLTGTANYKNGELSSTLNLLSDVYITTQGHVCPSCENGRCDSGRNKGAVCSPVSDIRVAATTYHLTNQCIPDGTPATLSVSLPITTGQSSIKQADCANLPVLCSKPQADQCHGSGCGTTCIGSISCPSKIHDPLKPTDPTAMVCVGQNGGISQNCCNDNPNQPCFPIANGGTLTRTGLATPPSGNPLTADEVEAATFCIPAIPPPNCATGDVAGLPAPGAIEWPVTTTWQ